MSREAWFAFLILLGTQVFGLWCLLMALRLWRRRPYAKDYLTVAVGINLPFCLFYLVLLRSLS